MNAEPWEPEFDAEAMGRFIDEIDGITPEQRTERGGMADLDAILAPGNPDDKEDTPELL